MYQELIQAKQERRTLWEKARALTEAAATEKRALTAEEATTWDKMDADLKIMTDAIERQERLLASQDSMKDKESENRAAFKPGTGAQTKDNEDAYSKAFRTWLVGGNDALAPEQRQLMQSKFVAAEGRQLGTTPGSAGGFLVPQGFYNTLVHTLRAFGGVRASRATVLTTASGQPLPIPTTDDTANTGILIAENTQISDLATTFGQRVLGAHTYTSRIVRVSLQLLQDSALDVETYLAGVMGERIGRISNTHFTIGTGTGQPQGVNIGATSGVVATAGSATSITYPNLVATQHSVDPAYRANAEWMFHDTTLRALKQMVDGQSRPLWTPGIALREPDTILGNRYVVNQDMPVMAANARSILYGDFSKFFVRDVLDIQVLRLTERYADFLQVGFLAFSRHDSALIDTAAVRFYQNSAT